MPDIYNIIVAAGRGSRFGADRPKQFCELNRRPVLMHTIQHFRDALPQSSTIVVLSSDYIDLWQSLCEKHHFTSPQIVTGGDTRWQSVKNAVDIIAGNVSKQAIITIHDGARPVIDSALINRVINGAAQSSGAIPVIPVTDSLRIVAHDSTSTPVNRASYRIVQTPQAFQASKLITAYSLPYRDSFTDDASVMAAASFEDITLVEGSPRNIKITHPADIDIAAIYLNGK